MCFSALDQACILVGSKLELGCRQIRHIPHIKYVVRPFYKALVARVGDVAATALTFAAADAAIHQFLGYPISCFFARLLAPTFSAEMQEKIVVEACTFSYNYLQTAVWTVMALPIMYVKYRRKQEVENPLLPA